MICIYYCPNCDCAGSQDNEADCPNCPDCGNRMYETMFSKTMWDTLTHDEKMAKKQNWKLVIDYLIQPSLQENKEDVTTLETSAHEKQYELKNISNYKTPIDISNKTVTQPQAAKSISELEAKQTTMFCNKCGNRLLPNSRFCNKCGAPIVKL